MVTEEEMEILWNIRYGGWKISKKTMELYKLKSPSNNVTENYFDYYFSILIQIYKEFGIILMVNIVKLKLKKLLKNMKTNMILMNTMVKNV
jgi:hypothetical protein